MAKINMSTGKKGKLISNIISTLKFQAAQEKKPFDAGDIFFSLCFKSDAGLKKIAKLAGA